MTSRTTLLSLSGANGILLGLINLLGLYLVFSITNGYAYNGNGMSQLPIAFLEIGVMVIAVFTIFLSLIAIFLLAKRRAKKRGVKLWNKQSKKLRLQVLFQLLVLIIILILIANMGYYSLMTPLILAFYGLLILSIRKMNSSLFFIVAIAMVLLAGIAFFISDQEFLLLSFGLGGLPILYGILTLGKKKQP